MTIYKDTALHLACYAGRLEVVQVLLGRPGGKECLIKENIWAETALHAACTHGRNKELVVHLITQANMSVHVQGKDGHTALHSACYQGHMSIVQLLLEHGADTSLTAKGPASVCSLTAGEVEKGDAGDQEEEVREQTPLHWAYERGHDEIVTLLKHYRRPEEEITGRGDYTPSGSEGSYVPVPSPLGRSCDLEDLSMTRKSSQDPKHHKREDRRALLADQPSVPVPPAPAGH